MKKEVKTSEQTPQSPDFFQELGCFMKPYRKKYAFSIVLSILSVAAGILSYALVGKIAALLFGADPGWSAVLSLALGAAVCKLSNSILLNLSTWISHKAAYYTLRDIRDALSNKLLKLPMGYFEVNGTGRLKVMLADHVESMEKTLAHMLPELTANLLCPLFCIIYMFILDWRLALTALIWIILGFSVTFGMMKGYEEKYAGQIKALKTMNQAVVEFVNGIEVIKNFGRAGECYQKYQDAVNGHAAYNVNWVKETQKYTSLGMAIAPFTLFPVLIAGLIFYSRGSLTPGTLFLMLLLTFGIFGPLMNASQYFDQLAGMGTMAGEIKAVLDYPELQRKGTAKAEDASVSFRNVTFSYEKSHQNALEDISFTIPQGTMLALTGPSGSGKSTIAKLLAGFWDADCGEILVGGHSIKDCSQEDLNRLVAYVDQETFLFDDSILNNIRIGCPDASREAVVECAGKAGCDDFIQALPEGYDTSAGTAGSRLSGGEKQRIAIARAMMKDAPILILDEATASSDPENEASIQKALSAAAGNKTRIVVAHRLNTVCNAQQIAYVESGRILAIGSHQELLNSCEGYRRMWNLQEVQ